MNKEIKNLLKIEMNREKKKGEMRLYVNKIENYKKKRMRNKKMMTMKRECRCNELSAKRDHKNKNKKDEIKIKNDNL